MSVRKGDRTVGNLQVLELAKQLVKYTLERVASERCIPKKQRWVLGDKIASACLNAVTNIRKANSVLVQTHEDYMLRRKYQNEAHAELGALYALVDVALNIYPIPSSTVETWSNLIYDTDEKLKAWMRSDKERYKNVI